MKNWTPKAERLYFVVRGDCLPVNKNKLPPDLEIGGNPFNGKGLTVETLKKDCST